MEDNKDQGVKNSEERSRKRPPMKVNIVKRTVDVDESEAQGVLSYDWDRDIQESPDPAPTVKCFYADEEKTDELDPLNIGPGKWRTAVRADPNDYIYLEMADGEKKIYHAHRQLWYSTIDKYLYAYYRLQEEKASGEWVELRQPDEANELLGRYWDRSQHRRKELPPIFTLENVKNPGGRKAAKGYHVVVVPKYIKNAMGNLLWRWLAVRKNDIHEQESLAFDGLPLWLTENTDLKYEWSLESIMTENESDEDKKKSISKVRAAGEFTLADYIFHEMNTGISLSIEITALLLEFEDQELMEKALQAFQKDALKDIVASPMLFSRICAARNFFQQILMEMAVDQYEWTLQKKTNQEEEIQWTQRVNRARAHVLSLHKPVLSGLYDAETDKSLEHLTELIKKMKKPVDLLGYTEKPEYGLAIFCNQAHKNVKFFVDELRIGQEQRRRDDPDTSEYRYELFRKVHAMVRKAIWYPQKK